MNLTRLMVLGTLASRGPMHGHQIRRIAEISNVGEWGGVSVGALYRELRHMDGDGLVEAVRTEKVGRRPARTIYAITDDGQLELQVLRSRAILEMSSGPDPMGVALAFAWHGIDPQEAIDTMRLRREQMAIAAEHLAAEAQRLQAKGHIGPAQAAVMRRGVLHMQTEVRWHDEFAPALAGLPALEHEDRKPGVAAGRGTERGDTSGSPAAAGETADLPGQEHEHCKPGLNAAPSEPATGETATGETAAPAAGAAVVTQPAVTRSAATAETKTRDIT